MAESIRERLDRVLDHIKDVGASARRIVLSHDDMVELQEDAAAEPKYRDVPIKRGEMGQSSYVDSHGAPSGDTNFGV